MAQIERVKKWINDHPVPAAAYVLLTLFGVILLVAIIGFPNSFPDWVGVAEVTTPGLEQSQKTLWDWLDLFIVSLVVALALFWLNTSQRRREDDREKKRVKLEKEQQAERQEQEKARQEDRQHQATLQNYFDKMSELLLKEHLGEKVEQAR